LKIKIEKRYFFSCVHIFWNNGYKIRRKIKGDSGLVFGVWGLVFGVWGLGFGCLAYGIQIVSMKLK
jgi:hypothetical protein